MFGLPRGAELIVILVIVLILFGPGRIGKLSGEIGKSIKAFREGLSDENDEDQPTDPDGNIESK
ncbi:MAG TPA: twin-arginine translocase TatA/TatE family subunit [Anaerolineales bacterium]|nr:twin-arginine translocase TatA/TatE family subunit [Anaerolineales bacterium]